MSLPRPSSRTTGAAGKISLMNILVLLVAAATAAWTQTTITEGDRAKWTALKEARFQIPEGKRAVDLLIEMNALLGSSDPFLRDVIAYSAAEQWILREHRLDADQLRRVSDLWLNNLHDGLG